MPLTKQDVLDTLNSYFVSQINFWVERVHVCPQTFAAVRVLIEDGDIQVVEGTDSHGHYYPDTNILKTQNVTSPPNFDGRALLLHECTHAIVDVEKYAITRLTNEVAAYIAQHTYLLLANPNYRVAPNIPPWFNFYNNVVALVKKFKLHRPAGQGAMLQWSDYLALRTEINALNLYSGVGARERELSDGVQVATNRGGFDSPAASFQSSSQESYPEASDDAIVAILAKRYAANDVAGFGGRLALLTQMFSHTEQVRAQALLRRLRFRMAGDKMSVYFHDHLSTDSRAKLLTILRLRY